MSRSGTNSLSRAIAARFEAEITAAWEAGERPDLPAFLAAAGSDRTALLLDLLPLDGRAEPAPGWTWANLADLALLAHSPADLRQAAELRHEAAVSLGSFDLRQQRVVADDLEANLVAFSPDGKYLASGGHDGMAFVWDLATKKQRAVMMGHKEEVRSLCDGPRELRYRLGELLPAAFGPGNLAP